MEPLRILLNTIECSTIIYTNTVRHLNVIRHQQEEGLEIDRDLFHELSSALRISAYIIEPCIPFMKKMFEGDEDQMRLVRHVEETLASDLCRHTGEDVHES